MLRVYDDKEGEEVATWHVPVVPINVSGGEGVV